MLRFCAAVTSCLDNWPAALQRAHYHTISEAYCSMFRRHTHLLAVREGAAARTPGLATVGRLALCAGRTCLQNITLCRLLCLISSERPRWYTVRRCQLTRRHPISNCQFITPSAGLTHITAQVSLGSALSRTNHVLQIHPGYGTLVMPWNTPKHWKHS